MKDSVLAWRLEPKTRRVHTAWSVPLQVVLVPVFAVMTIAWLFETICPKETSGFFAIVSGVLVLANYRTAVVKDFPQPIVEEHPVWSELVEKLAESSVERDHVFLGTICEEYEQ
jgi:hypothetical protein